jgi:hypothetical protein
LTFLLFVSIAKSVVGDGNGARIKNIAHARLQLKYSAQQKVDAVKFERTTSISSNNHGEPCHGHLDQLGFKTTRAV